MHLDLGTGELPKYPRDFVSYFCSFEQGWVLGCDAVALLDVGHHGHHDHHHHGLTEVDYGVWYGDCLCVVGESVLGALEEVARPVGKEGCSVLEFVVEELGLDFVGCFEL